MTEWFNDPVGHGYITAYQGSGTDTPHYAYDIETPFHTPLTAPTSGTVKEADYQAWGGEIFVQPDDKSLPEWYMYHPDEIEVKAGQHVNAGQEIGLSGGENPGYPGAEHPASTAWSTGPHTHVGWFTRWQNTPDGTRPFGPDPANLLALAKGGGGVSSMVPANVYQAVEPYAQQYGVPDPVWETIAYIESGLNPAPTPGDNGTSYGLFQLHQGGQFPSAYDSNPTALNDPGLNAKYAMPAIGAAWKQLEPSFDPSSASWWEQFAAESGHPGGAPGQTVTDSEASRLQSSYSTFANGGSAGAAGATTTLDFKATAQQCGFNPVCWIQQAGAAAGSGASSGIAQGITGWIGASVGPFLLRVGVGVAGLALIWIGINEMAAALKSGNDSPAAPAPAAPAPAAPASSSKPKAKKEEAKPKDDAPGAKEATTDTSAGAAGGATEAAELAAVA